MAIDGDGFRMSQVERAFLWRRQFLDPYAFEGYSSRSGTTRT